VSTVVVSAVVAAIVTLLVEYLAKPWLEARKEAMLDGQRFDAISQGKVGTC
jgi:hypothetical protein